MVNGLALFKNHFSNHVHQYVLIGGTACTVLMEEAGLAFRATKDLDIVLYVEALERDFSGVFWEFVRMGGYRYHQKSTEKKTFYRFSHPSNPAFPSMLELFSRQSDAIKLPPECRLTPISISDGSVSLSAILLNDDYYHFIHSGKSIINGMSLLNATHLIPIKARAWIDLRECKSNGESIDDKNIRKHKNDILRLYQLLTPTNRTILPEPIRQDMQQFLTQIEKEGIDSLKNLGLQNTSLTEILHNLRIIYSIE